MQIPWQRQLIGHNFIKIVQHLNDNDLPFPTRVCIESKHLFSSGLLMVKITWITQFDLKIIGNRDGCHSNSTERDCKESGIYYLLEVKWRLHLANSTKGFFAKLRQKKFLVYIFSSSHRQEEIWPRASRNELLHCAGTDRSTELLVSIKRFFNLLTCDYTLATYPHSFNSLNSDVGISWRYGLIQPISDRMLSHQSFPVIILESGWTISID